MKEGGNPQPRDVKVPVVEVLKSFAHREGFGFFARQVMAKPFQVMCKTSEPSWVLCQCVCLCWAQERCLSPEGHNFLFYFSCSATACAQCLGWCGELEEGTEGLWCSCCSTVAAGSGLRCHYCVTALACLPWLFSHECRLLLTLVFGTILKLLKIRCVVWGNCAICTILPIVCTINIQVFVYKYFSVLIHSVFLGGAAVSTKRTDFELAQLNLEVWACWWLECL